MNFGELKIGAVFTIIDWAYRGRYSGRLFIKTRQTKHENGYWSNARIIVGADVDNTPFVGVNNVSYIDSWAEVEILTR